MLQHRPGVVQQMTGGDESRGPKKGWVGHDWGFGSCSKQGSLDGRGARPAVAGCAKRGGEARERFSVKVLNGVAHLKTGG